MLLACKKFASTGIIPVVSSEQGYLLNILSAGAVQISKRTMKCNLLNFQSITFAAHQVLVYLFLLATHDQTAGFESCIPRLCMATITPQQQIS
jgi:hypothetical protein